MQEHGVANGSSREFSTSTASFIKVVIFSRHTSSEHALGPCIGRTEEAFGFRQREWFLDIEATIFSKELIDEIDRKDLELPESVHLAGATFEGPSECCRMEIFTGLASCR